MYNQFIPISPHKGNKEEQTLLDKYLTNILKCKLSRILLAVFREQFHFLNNESFHSLSPHFRTSLLSICQYALTISSQRAKEKRESHRKEQTNGK